MRAQAKGDGMSRNGRNGRPRLFAGLLALLPSFGADQAEVAVEQGNALYEAGQYEAALERYEAAAEALPELGRDRRSITATRCSRAMTRSRRSTTTWPRWRRGCGS